MNSANFCIECGSPMIDRDIAGRKRRICPECGWVHYLHLKVAAAVLIERDGGLLLLKRADLPWAGDWNLPAGYLEVDERPEEAAAREAREETGLEVRVEKLFGHYYFDDDPRGNGLLIVFQGTEVGGTLRFDAESSALGFFDPSALPENICGAGHRRAIKDWKTNKAALS